MKDELQQKLIDLIEIGSSQFPEFAQEIVDYQIWCSSVSMYSGMTVFCFMLLLIIIFLFCSKDDKSSDYFGRDYFGKALVTLILTIFPILWVSCEYVILNKCHKYPKLVVIDYLKRGSK